MKQKINNLIKWIKPSFEGTDGNLSHKKLSTFVMLLLLVFMVITTGLIASIYPDVAWITITAGASAMAGIGAYQNIKLNKTKEE